jgi:hypothetical protein
MTSFTPKGNYPYPVPTDPVTDYPSSAATFAGYVDNLPNRNAIINGQFAITQRGTTFSNPATGSYSADRWRFDYDGTGGTRAITFPSISPGASMSGMQAKNVVQIAMTTGSTGGTYQRFAQRIEDVRTFANETITLSFWVYSSSPKTITARAVQNFGTGGSPSAEVSTVIATTTTSGAVYERKNFTVTLPSLSGKTIGTNENSYLEIHLDLGVQTGTIAFWGVQLEQNNTATALERRPIQQEIALCQRFYEKSYALNVAPGTNTTDGALCSWGSTQSDGVGGIYVPFKVRKRLTTSYTASGTVNTMDYLRLGVSGTGAATIFMPGDTGFSAYCSVGSNNVAARYIAHWTVSAEL